MVSALDGILLFNAGVFSLFALPHLIAEDGNTAAMGFTYAQFMPLKGRSPLPVPEEINLLISHLCAILGAGQLALVLMCLMGYASSEATNKRLAVRTMLLYSMVSLLVQVYKPSGTGAVGSPASGPIPIIIALALPTLYGTLAC